jgi:pilus assembly protein Flp/PilA
MLRNIVSKFLVRVARDEEGLTAVEYAVLGGLIVAAIGAAVTAFAADLSAAFAILITP